MTLDPELANLLEELNTGGSSGYNDEKAQDAVGTILGSNFTYDDVAPSITLKNNSITVSAKDGVAGGGTVPLGGTVDVSIQPADFAGRFISEDGSDNLQANLGLGLPNHHVNYAGGLSDEELSRFTLPSGQMLELWRLETALKGGGTNSNVSLDVYDETDQSILGSVEGGERKQGTSSPLGKSVAGATILIRLSTGGTSVNLTPTGITSLVNK